MQRVLAMADHVQDQNQPGSIKRNFPGCYILIIKLYYFVSSMGLRKSESESLRGFETMTFHAQVGGFNR